MHQPRWKHDEGAAAGGAGAAEACGDAVFDAHSQCGVVGGGDHAAWVGEFQVAADGRVVFSAAGVHPVDA